MRPKQELSWMDYIQSELKAPQNKVYEVADDEDVKSKFDPNFIIGYRKMKTEEMSQKDKDN